MVKMRAFLTGSVLLINDNKRVGDWRLNKWTYHEHVPHYDPGLRNLPPKRASDVIACFISWKALPIDGSEHERVSMFKHGLCSNSVSI